MHAQDWPQTAAWIKTHKLSNLHRHAAGSLSAASLARLYLEHPLARDQFANRYMLDPVYAHHIEQVMDAHFETIDQSWEQFEDAFTPARLVLDQGDERQMHYRWFRFLAADSADEGLAVSGIRATFGGHWRSEADFENLLTAAIDGILDGEREGGERGKVVLFLALRKDMPPEKAFRRLRIWNETRVRQAQANPQVARIMVGIDSVGSERQFQLDEQTPVWEEASANGCALTCHLGEQWEPGGLLTRLEQIQELLERVQVAYLTNANALWVDTGSLARSGRSQAEVRQISDLQAQICARLIQQGVILEISPTSNDVLTRTRRRQEGWQFVPLQVMLARGVSIAVTDDSSLIFRTSYLDELRRLYHGTTAFGRIGPAEIGKIVETSEVVYAQVCAGREVG
jgi:adenosine deaminase